MQYDKPIPAEPDLVSCSVCLKEIPKSVAETQEGLDYVHHFCGLPCYETWRNQHQDTPTES